MAETRLILAILPSNQDQNPVVGGGAEMQHIAPLAAAVLAVARSYSSMVAEVFTGAPQSADSPRGSLSGLVAQQRAAAAWIASVRRDGDLTVALNIHSDSGTERHCGYYYDSEDGPVSKWLSRELADTIKRWFGNKVYSADYSGYIFAQEMRAVACPVLIEWGTHTQAADVAAVREHTGEMVAATVNCLAGFFGLDAIPSLNTAELRTYGEWALARLANGEDSRNVDAFRAHVDAIGADSADLRRWGLPC